MERPRRNRKRKELFLLQGKNAGCLLLDAVAHDEHHRGNKKSRDRVGGEGKGDCLLPKSLLVFGRNRHNDIHARRMQQEAEGGSTIIVLKDPDIIKQAARSSSLYRQGIDW